jgi:shikimate kinase
MTARAIHVRRRSVAAAEQVSGTGSDATTAAPGPGPTTGCVVLMGMTGVGKTTVGRALGRRWSWPHLDIDEEVERRVGCSVADLWRTRGEAAFRRAERAALADVLGGDVPSVVSVGGGAVVDPATRRVLRSAGRLVWLRASDATIIRRLLAADPRAGDRPVLQGDPATVVPVLSARRHRWYEELAGVIVDVDDAGVDEIAHRVEVALRLQDDSAEERRAPEDGPEALAGGEDPGGPEALAGGEDPGGPAVPADAVARGGPDPSVRSSGRGRGVP